MARRVTSAGNYRVTSAADYRVTDGDSSILGSGNYMNDLIDHIDSNTALTTGTDLWPHQFPKDVELGVALIYAGGAESESNMQKLMIQIVSIGVDAVTAKTNIDLVYNLLAYNNGLTLASGYLFNCIPLSTPKFLHLNNHNYPVFTASVVIIKERT